MRKRRANTVYLNDKSRVGATAARFIIAEIDRLQNGTDLEKQALQALARIVILGEYNPRANYSPYLHATLEASPLTEWDKFQERMVIDPTVRRILCNMAVETIDTGTYEFKSPFYEKQPSKKLAAVLKNWPKIRVPLGKRL